MKVFWNSEEERLRALWRLLAQALLAIAFAAVPILLVAEPLTWLHRRDLFLPGLGKEAYDHAINFVVGPLLTLAVIGSVAVARRKLDRRGWEAYGVRFDARWWACLAGGFGLGALLMTAIFAVEAALGWVRLEGLLVANTAAVSIPVSLAFSTVKDLCVGIYEELVSRGYLLRNVSDGLGRTWGIVVSSSVFSVLHLMNPNASVLSTLGLFAAGLLLAVARLRTGRLSTAIGLHIAWNLFEGPVFGFPVSGDLEGASLLGIVQGGPELWTGGAFGPEAGLVGIVAALAGIAILLGYPLGTRTRRPPC